MTKRLKDARIKNKRNKQSVLSLDLDVDTIKQLTKMSKLADVTFNQLVRVILMLEMTKLINNPEKVKETLAATESSNEYAV